MLRNHDIYVTGSKNDPCFHALIEGLSCGLPRFITKMEGTQNWFLQEDCHFEQKTEILEQLDRLWITYELFQESNYGVQARRCGRQIFKYR